MIEKVGGRKFLLAVLVMLIASVGVILGNVEWQQFLEFSKWILGIFAVANAGQKLIKN